MPKNLQNASKKEANPPKDTHSKANPAHKQEKEKENPENPIKVFDPDFSAHSKKLSLFYSRFLSARNNWEMTPTSSDLFLKWLDFYHERTEEELFRGVACFQAMRNPENIYKSPNEKIFFQNYNFFKIVNMNWPLRFESISQ